MFLETYCVNSFVIFETAFEPKRIRAASATPPRNILAHYGAFTVNVSTYIVCIFNIKPMALLSKRTFWSVFQNWYGRFLHFSIEQHAGCATQMRARWKEEISNRCERLIVVPIE